ncbi:MAG: ArsA family ATPase [candidate division NC10 bacterium]|nr:ArsA family ATPase [candidate division NC10 bacterium]MBI2458238.1 ArsA family ATPase [candidate division NC10 bacterium]MBI2562360.1 ArsA family ATPase [candidate division NC10 bacterium]
MLKLILFGGKGGVGKTTCASAAAVQLADAGMRTLLLSSDPAHSLSDCLEQEVGPEITPVDGVRGLWAVEISAEKLYLEFREEHGEEISRILETGTYLDAEDITGLLSLPIPGLDEVMGFKELVDLMEKEEYDLYVLDTAPTGHALRLLALPEVLDQWIRILARIRYKYQYVVSRLSGKQVREAADDFLFSMKRALKKVHALLRDPDRCEFVVVTAPEAMVIAETRRLTKALATFGIAVNHLIVNRVISSDHRDCLFCYERWQGQRGDLQEIEASFSAYTRFKILELPRQLRGVKMLRDLPCPPTLARRVPSAAR